MKLNKLFLIMLALPLALVACNKNETPISGSDYLFDVKMTQAERVKEIAEEGIILEDNQFMLVFTDQNESCMLSLFIQGEDGETVLAAGTYNRALVLDSCVFVAEDETAYSFNEGVVNIALDNKVYNIEALLTDANGKEYRFTYEGEIANMTEEDEYSEYFVHRDMTSADRLLPIEKYEISEGDIGILFFDKTSYTYFAMVFTPEEGKDVLTAGTYSVELGNLKVTEGFYSNGNTTETHYFVDGEVSVEGDVDGYKFEFLLYDDKDRTFHITYDGIVKWMMTTFDDSEYSGLCFGHFEGCENYNYVLWFGRNIGNEYENDPRKQRFVVNIYADEVEIDSNGYYKIPNGTYTLDNTNSTATGTISMMDTYIELGQEDTIFKDATLVITDEGATLTATVYKDLNLQDAFDCTLTYKGEVLAKQSEDFVADL